MVGDDEMEEDDDDDVDFNPYLQRSPSPEAEGESGDSLNRVEDGDDSQESLKESHIAEGEIGKSLRRVEEEEDVYEREVLEEEADGVLTTTEYVDLLEGEEDLLEGEEQIGEYDGDDKFFELGSDDGEEGEFEEVDQEEEVAHDDDDDGEGGGGLELGHFSPNSASYGKEKEYLEGCLNLGADEVIDWNDEERGQRNLDCLEKSVDLKDGSPLATRIVDGTQDCDEKSMTDFVSRSDKQAVGMPTSEIDDKEGKDVMDAISKRTRANYSLADMSLDQLEMFLQESDEEDNLQTVDDEEEYRKFLLALQEDGGPTDQKPEQGGRKEDEDDDEDMDFEVEIEEALESDDASESVRRRRRRRPETREKRRQRAQLQARGGSILAQSSAPLRHLLPYVGNLGDDGAMLEKRKTITETVNIVWPPRAKRKPPVNGFTAHQIGQLYCLIHEHVQLLVQVFSLCVLDPGRQQIAIDSHRMLMELVEKRELLLSWKKTAFPDFCFRPPYTHPSLIEDKVVGSAFTSDISSPASTCFGQGAPAQSNGYPGYSFTQGSSSAADPHSFGQNFRALNLQETSACTPTFSVPPQLSTSSTGGLEQANISTSYYSFSGHFSETMAAAPAQPAVLLPPGSLSNAVAPANLARDRSKFEWAPITSGPVRSLLDVAPLALVRDFLVDVAQVAQDYRQSCVETGPFQQKFVKEPLFMISATNEQNQVSSRNQREGPQLMLGGGDMMSAGVPRPQVKKTMAAALVESTKKQSLALVPKDAAAAVQRFLPFFNKSFFPHKPPPAATASRLLFTDAEDELLAMGLMMYNTDWEAIRQRFLPPKSMHQIFVRQKNRSSARAPENSIKAVRKMKSSPLTSAEKASIQEGLGMFKYDWTKVWQYCVPHRDPALLARQWRIAVGTQKSYKTSETSKERRRLYEANRRQRIASNKVKSVTGDEERANTSAPAINGEGKAESGTKDGDDSDKVFIREAFLDDWCPRSTIPVISCSPSNVKPKKASLSASKKRKASVALEPRFSSLSGWVGSQPVKTITERRKQTVQLAPGLPSVKLPPRVQILKQSLVQAQAPFALTGRRPPETAQWPHAADQRLEKLPVRPFLAKYKSQHETRLHEPVCITSQQSMYPVNQFVFGQEQAIGSMSKDKSARSPHDHNDLTSRDQEEQADKNLGLELSPQKNEMHGRALKSSGESTLASDMLCPSMEDFSLQCDPQGCSDRDDSVQQRTIPAKSRNENDAYGDELGHEIDKRLALATSPIAQVEPNQSAKCCASNSSHLMGAPYAARNVQICSLQSPIQVSLPSSTHEVGADYQLMTRCMPASEVVAAESGVQSDLVHGQVGVRAAGVLAEQSFKTNRSPSKINRKVRGPSKNTQKSSQRMPKSTPKMTGSIRRKISGVLVEGVIQDAPLNSRRRGGRNVKRNYSSKGQKVAEVCVGLQSQETQLEEHVIVMEQEELSDSEEEAAAGVQFEHEEMGDSDKDADGEIGN